MKTEPEWALHFVAPQLGVDSTSSLFSLHVQDVLWHRKPFFKVNGRAGRSPVLESWDVWFWVREQTVGPPHITSHAPSPLPVPALLNLFACLCQRCRRSACSAHSELIDPPPPPTRLAKTSHSVTLPSLTSNSITSPGFLFLILCTHTQKKFSFVTSLLPPLLKERHHKAAVDL